MPFTLRRLMSLVLLLLLVLVGQAHADDLLRLPVEEGLVLAQDSGQLGAVLFVDADEADARAAIKDLPSHLRDQFLWVVRSLLEDGRITPEARHWGIRRGPSLLLFDPWADADGRVLARLPLRGLTRELQRAITTASRRGHPPLTPVRWEVTSEAVEARAGDRSAFDLTDAELTAMAVRESTTRGVPVTEDTRHLWSTLLRRSRDEGREGVALSACTLRYDWVVDGRGRPVVTFRGRGVTVQLVPAQATPELRSHEAGHGVLFASAFLNEGVARLAYRGLLQREDPARLREAGDSTVDAVLRLSAVLNATFDRVTEHRGDRQYAEALALALQRLLRQQSAKPGASVLTVESYAGQRLAALGARADPESLLE